jgi:antitoxin (DNA-binding transcriptional repressor) of toxin-antitoxin stability system
MRSPRLTRTVSPQRVRRDLDALLEEVFSRGSEFVIARAGKPMAAVVPVSYLREQTKARARFFRMVAQVWKRNRSVPPEVTEAEVAEAVRAVRSNRSRGRG